MMDRQGRVVAVARCGEHRFSKVIHDEILLSRGLGVDGDAHQGMTVRHRSRVAIDPTQPNLRQVHLMASELLKELAEKGFPVRPADLGENITTEGLDLLSLPRGACLTIGNEVRLDVTGLRNPCAQIDGFRRGLLSHLVERGSDGAMILKAGIMTVVRQGGRVRAGDVIKVELPALPHEKLERV